MFYPGTAAHSLVKLGSFDFLVSVSAKRTGPALKRGAMPTSLELLVWRKGTLHFLTPGRPVKGCDLAAALKFRLLCELFEPT